MGRECHEVTSHWPYFGRQVTCPHNFCQDCNYTHSIIEKAHIYISFAV